MSCCFWAVLVHFGTSWGSAPSILSCPELLGSKSFAVTANYEGSALSCSPTYASACCQVPSYENATARRLKGGRGMGGMALSSDVALIGNDRCIHICTYMCVCMCDLCIYIYMIPVCVAFERRLKVSYFANTKYLCAVQGFFVLGRAIPRLYLQF